MTAREGVREFLFGAVPDDTGPVSRGETIHELCDAAERGKPGIHMGVTGCLLATCTHERTLVEDPNPAAGPSPAPPAESVPAPRPAAPADDFTLELRDDPHRPQPRPREIPVWTLDDLYWLMRPFSAALRPRDRLAIAKDVFGTLSRDLAHASPKGPPRAVNPLPPLAAKLADYFSVTPPPAEFGWATAPDSLIVDFLSEAELLLLEKWAEPAPPPSGPENLPGPTFDDLPAEVKDHVRRNGPVWAAAAAKLGQQAAPVTPAAPAAASEPKVGAAVVLAKVLGTEYVLSDVHALDATAVGFVAALTRTRRPIIGTLTMCPPEAVPVSSNERARVYRSGAAGEFQAGKVSTLDTTTEQAALRERAAAVLTRMFRIASSHAAVADVVEVVVPQVPKAHQAHPETVRFPVLLKPDDSAGRVSLLGSANAMPVVVTARVPSGATRLTEQRWEGRAPRTAAKLVARVAAALVPFHDLGMPHGAVRFDNVLATDAAEATLGPPRPDLYLFEYTPDDLLERVLTKDRTHVCECEYGPDDALAQVTYFNQHGQMSAQLDGDGNWLAHFKYDENARLVSVTETTEPWESALSAASQASAASRHAYSPAADGDAPVPPRLLLADIRDLGRLLYRLLTGKPAAGRPGERMPAAEWDLCRFPNDTPAELVELGRDCAAAAERDMRHSPLVVARALRDIAKRGHETVEGLLPAWNPNVPTGTVGDNVFDRYFLMEELGRGAFGVVYKARDEILDAEIALKIYQPDFSEAGVIRGMWEREAHMLYALQHPSIPRFVGVGKWRGRPYTATEFVSGPTLAKEIARLRHAAAGRGRAHDDHTLGAGCEDTRYERGEELYADAAAGQLDPEWVARVMQYVAEAIGFAHAHNVVHRDIKPANVILAAADVTGPESVRVIDFGLSRSTGRTDKDDSLPGAGTPSYMAPEQFAGDNDRIGPWTDVWALGVMMYEMLTGHRPFAAPSIEERRKLVLDPDVKPARPKYIRRELDELDRSDPGVHVSLSRIALTCLNKDVKQRYQSADQVARQIALWREGLRDRAATTSTP